MDINSLIIAVNAQSSELAVLTLVEGTGRRSTGGGDAMDKLREEIRKGKYRKELFLRAHLLEAEGMKTIRETRVVDVVAKMDGLGLEGYRRVGFRLRDAGTPVSIEIHPSASRKDVIASLKLALATFEKQADDDRCFDEVCPGSAPSREDSEHVFPMPLSGVSIEGATGDWPVRGSCYELQLSRKCLGEMDEIAV